MLGEPVSDHKEPVVSNKHERETRDQYIQEVVPCRLPPEGNHARKHF
jgi:hypothetical protein